MTDFGQVLITLRLARGLSQADLAEKTGMTQAALSRYENGMRQPNGDARSELATALGVTSEFLAHSGRTHGAMAVDVHMRRRATAKASDWRRFEAKLNEHRMHTSLLFEEVSTHADQIVPRFDGEDPADAARLVRMQWRMPIGPVRTLIRWIESAGCVVFEEDFGTPRIDGMSQWVGDHPIMLLNQAAPTDRKRLTAAHELGHLVLHSEFVGDNLEEEANQFASEFLMPREAIRYQLNRLNLGRLADLKREWGVSMAALVERAFALDMMTGVERTRMYKMFSTKGIRINEPGSDSIPPEVPGFATHVGESLIARGMDENEIAQMAGYRGSGESTNPFLAERSRLRLI